MILAIIPIAPIFLDEEGGDAVVKYRQLVSTQSPDAVIGYTSSANCLAIGPIAEALKALTIFFDCGAPRIFEESSYRYVFRTASHLGPDNIAAARYLLEIKPDVKTVSGINENYAWGQDSWELFSKSLQQLQPEVQLRNALFPQLLSGQYSTEITRLVASRPDAVHSSLWGGGLIAFLNQSLPRGLLSQTTPIFITGETQLPDFLQRLPEGVIISSRGAHGVLAPDNDLDRWFKKAYYARFGEQPAYPAYHMAQAILGLKSAYENAHNATGSWPDTESVIEHLEYLEYETPSGTIALSLGSGHQAVEGAGFATIKRNPDTGENELQHIRFYEPACINPPEGITTIEWIQQGFPGAQCQ